MHIIIGGCGRLGSEIAEKLSEDTDTDIVVIDLDALTFDRLGSAFNGETLHGDVTDRDVLERAGIERADGLLAVTRSDNANLMAVQTATHLYGVPRAVARLFNPERESTYRKLDVRYVSGTGILAKLFINDFRDSDFPQHIHFQQGDLEMVDLHLGSAVQDLTVDEFEELGRLRIAAIQRGTHSQVAAGGLQLHPGDLVTVALSRTDRRRIRHLLQLPGNLNEPAPAGRPGEVATGPRPQGRTGLFRNRGR